MKIASFDLFDTLFLRLCGAPENIFYLLAQALFDDKTRQMEFYRWRKSAESKLKQIETSLATLDDIYSSYCFSEYDKSFVMDKEQQIEKANIVINPFVSKIIVDKINDGYEVFFISDMYLSSTFLLSVLIDNHIPCDLEHLFVSCEMKKSKRNSMLFSALKMKYKYSVWEHYGDNRTSDYRRPKALGIEAYLINTDFTPVEQNILNAKRGKDAWFEYSIFVGYMRVVRLLNGGTAQDVIASDFVAPFIVSYVYYILNDCRKKGFTRLYFLARDAYIIKETAKEFSGMFPEIEISYIYLSRKSLCCAYLQKFTKEELLSFFNNSIVHLSVKSVFEFLQMDEDDYVKATGQKFGFSTIKSKDEQNQFLDILFSEKSVAYLREVSGRYRQLVLDYFSQVGLFDESNYSFVDVGWLGSTRYSITQILKDCGVSSTHFYYYAVLDNVYSSDSGKYTVLNRNLKVKSWIVNMVENYFCLNYDTSTVSYSKEDGVVEPVFSKKDSMTPELRLIADSNIAASTHLARLCMARKELFPLLLEVGEDTLNLLSNSFTEIPLAPFSYMHFRKDNERVKTGVDKYSLYNILRGVFVRASATPFWKDASLYYTSHLLYYICRFSKVGFRSIKLWVKRSTRKYKMPLSR